MTYNDTKDEVLRILDDTDLESQCFEAWLRTMTRWCYGAFYVVAILGLALVPNAIIRGYLVFCCIGMAFSYRKAMRKWRPRG